MWREGDDGPADYIISWQAPAALLCYPRGAKAVFNLGAGVDAILRHGDQLPQGLNIVRLDDAGMGQQMADYVTAAVLRFFRRFDEYARQQHQHQQQPAAAPVWLGYEHRARKDFPIAVLGVGTLGSFVARTLLALGFPVRGWTRGSRRGVAAVTVATATASSTFTATPSTAAAFSTTFATASTTTSTTASTAAAAAAAAAAEKASGDDDRSAADRAGGCMKDRDDNNSNNDNNNNNSNSNSIPGLELFTGKDLLSAFLTGAKVLVNMLPLTPETENILNTSTLSLLADGAYVVNVARGRHVVDEDLLSLLDAGKLAGAVLDVFRQEPLPATHRYWSHPKVLVTPHVAALTLREESIDQIVQKLKRIEEGVPLEQLPGFVDRKRGY